MNRSIEEVNEIARIAMTDKDVRNAMLDMALQKDKENLIYEYGEKQKAVEIAKKMKEKNKSLDEIVEFTGLTKEEIEKL